MDFFSFCLTLIMIISGLVILVIYIVNNTNKQNAKFNLLYLFTGALLLLVGIFDLVRENNTLIFCC